MGEEDRLCSANRPAQRAALVVLAAALFLPGLGGAQEPDAEQRALIGRGRASYLTYCSNCHGPEGKGDGRIVKWLKVAPSDLTLLSKENDGEFPADRVRRVIDGREEVKSHGSREMPIWGDVFQEPEAEEDPGEEARRKIDQLVAYLKFIQEDVPANGEE